MKEKSWLVIDQKSSEADLVFGDETYSIPNLIQPILCLDLIWMCDTKFDESTSVDL